MDNQNYLNQIAASSQPINKPNDTGKFSISNILHSKFFLVGIISFVVFLIIVIIGNLLGGNKTDSKTKLIQLQYHTDYTMEIIDEYQPKIKSSDLRSYSASLRTVLANTKTDITNYLTAKYNYKESKEDETLTTEIKTESDALGEELFEAKINGILDRTYAHKMAFEITKFMTEESQLIKSIKDETFSSSLNQSYSSLENLYNNFNDFSETKQ